jgi:hypothetical protein
LTSRRPGPRDQTAGRHDSVPPWEAAERLDVVPEAPAQPGAKPRNRPSQLPRVRVLRRGRPAAGSLHGAAPVVVVPKPGQRHREALLHRRSGAPRRDATTVGGSGHLLAARGQVVLAGGVLDMRQQRGAGAPAVHPAPAESACRPQRRGLDVGLREHAPAPAPGDVLGSAWVVRGFAPMEGCQVEGRPEADGQALLRPPIGQPGPREEPFDRDDHLVTVRGHDLQTGLRVGLELLVHHDVPILLSEADGQRPGVEIDPTIRLVLVRVAWPEVSSS